MVQQIIKQRLPGGQSPAHSHPPWHRGLSSVRNWEEVTGGQQGRIKGALGSVLSTVKRKKGWRKEDRKEEGKREGGRKQGRKGGKNSREGKGRKLR